ESKIKEYLINFVRSNVKYQRVPDWQNSYVNPPVLTLVKGYGECTDMSVLLSSLFINSGIKNVNLCFADTQGYGIDHLVVGVDNDGRFEIWDATCSDCRGSATESSKYWKLNCFDINEYIKKPLQRCYDNTPYNECSSLKGFYCDQGNLIPKCDSCGCPDDAICYNNGCYKCKEGTFIDGQCVI
ncbi:hypothetical protein HYX17_00560, partial [Candidatus Woesearchaeota archaeon]|nr:hypothetical protein [Candidatus Woesearchaeota archaeon]